MDQRIKETNPSHLELIIKALDVLKYSVDDPTTVGLPDPNAAIPDAAAAQRQTKSQKSRTTPDSYVAAVTGKSGTPAVPIGAKVPSAKATAKPVSVAIGAPIQGKASAKSDGGAIGGPISGKASAKSDGGAIGAPIPGKAKAKSSADSPPAGAVLTTQYGPANPSDTNLPADSAMNYITNAAPDQSFADYQSAQSAQGTQDAQVARDAQTAEDAVTAQTLQDELDAQAAGDTQAAQDTQTAQDASQTSAPTQGKGPLEWDDADDAAMQQALWQSRQQAQTQGSDPTASSSSATGRTKEDELQYELAMGRDLKREIDLFENKMSTGRLTADEVQRLRTVLELSNINKQRVADQAQQAPDTSVLLGSLQPLQPSKPKVPIQKTAPKQGVVKAMPPPPVVVKQLPGTSGTKAPPPVLSLPKPPPVKDPQTQQQSGDHQESDNGPPPDTLPSTKITGRLLLAPTSPKGPSAARLQQPLISPKGRPPARIAIPSKPANQSGVTAATTDTPRSNVSEDTVDLEARLERKREAKRRQSDVQEGEHQDERDQPNGDPIIMKKNVALVEMVDGRDDLHVRNLHLLKRTQMMTIGQHQLEVLDLEDMSDQDAIGLGHDSSEEKRRSRSEKRKDEHRSSKERRRRDDSPPPEHHEEDKSKDRSSQQSQSQVEHDQQRPWPPLPPPTTAPAASSQPAQVPVAQATLAPTAQPAPAQVAQQAPVQVAQTAPARVAKAAPAQVLATHAIGAATAQLPMAKAMPIQQQSQGQALPQPLPQPVYPPQSAMLQVPARCQAQQLAALPGLGTDLERTQAAQIQQMHQEMAQLQAQLRAVQAQPPQRPSSQSLSGNWGWNDPSQPGQWHGHGWQNWGNGRGYQ